MIEKTMKNKKINKTTNLGIQLLRMIFSFFIVLRHSYSPKKYSEYFDYFPFRVYTSTFFIISFYFSYNCFISRDIKKITQRFKRLLVPYLVWPIIFFIKNIIINSSGNKNWKNLFKYLFYQLVIGCGINNVFWFQFNLIFTSLLFIIIILLFPIKYKYILQILGIFSYVIKYCGYNDKIFLKYNDIAKLSTNNIAGGIVLALTGFLVSSNDFINICNKNRKGLAYKLIIFQLLIKINSFIMINYYPYIKGILINIVALNFFIIFSMIPFDKINNDIIISMIKQITNYTGGVYYIHIPILITMQNYFNIIKYQTFNLVIHKF